MTTTTKIPTAEELKDRLAGLDALLTAKQWERAAIVYAFTTNAGPGGGRTKRNPPPPKMTMREFARQGFAGLTTNKSVERYRATWVLAINRGWAVPVDPGDLVRLPHQEFPAWQDSRTREARQWRPVEQRVFSGIDQAGIALRRLPFITDEITPAFQAELVDRLTKLRQETDEALAVLATTKPQRHLAGV